ncbi:MAG: EamA family transporter, partial [Bacteroidales bacterium]|nr:EamA family transporter [Bacteroidales bacterium]
TQIRLLSGIAGNGINPYVLSSSSLFSGGLIIYLISLFFERGLPRAEKTTEYWLILFWLSFVSAYAFSLWFRLLQRPGVKVSELNLWKFIIPVVGAVLSWLIVPGEKPEWLTVAGILIITSSLILFFINGGLRKRRQNST